MKKKIFFTGCCLLFVILTSNAFAQSSLFERVINEKAEALQWVAQERIVTTFENMEMIENDDEVFELVSILLPNSTGLASIMAINNLDITPDEKAKEFTRAAFAGLSCDEWLQIAVIAFVVDLFVGVIPYSILFLIWLLCYLGVL